MNKIRWAVLIVVSLLSAHIYTFGFSLTTRYMSWIFGVLSEQRHLAIAIHLLVGTLISAFLTVIPLALIVRNKENLVPAALALLPYSVVLSTYVSNYILETEANPLFAVVMGLSVLLVPVSFLYTYRLVQLLTRQCSAH